MLYQRVCFAMVLALLIGGAASRVAGAERPPNFVIVFIDDMGYADTGPFGAKGYATPQPRPPGQGRRPALRLETGSAPPG